MNVIIQCAATKRAEAGTLLAPDGTPVMFVANPAIAPPRDDLIYARPDDPTTGGGTWRQVLVDYNQTPDTNPLGLLPAIELYRHPVYQGLARKFGLDHVFVLSAGWGLLPASFLTPNYDITFSQAAERFKIRSTRDRFEDFTLPAERSSDPVVFLGGRGYLSLFDQVTTHVTAPRTVFYNSDTSPPIQGCRLVRFQTPARTNWHYLCAEALLRGALDLAEG